MLVRALPVAVSIAEREEVLGFLPPPKSPDCGESRLASLLPCPGRGLWRVPDTGEGCWAFTSK